MDYNKIFEELAAKESHGNKYMSKQVDFDRNDPCRYKIKLAVDKDDSNTRCVVFQLANGGKEANRIINNINTLSSFNIDVYPAEISAVPDVNYIIKLQKDTEDELFSKFIDDLIGVVKSSKDRVIILDLLKRVKSWMNFFKGKSNGVLSENKQLGLFAELSALRELIKANSDSLEEVVLSWVGPMKQNQDFIFPDSSAIEVKCTSKNNANLVSISNELQLDDVGLDNLYLSVYQVKRHKLKSESSFETLPNLVDEIKELLKTNLDASLEFENLLINVGYLDEFEIEYADFAFQILMGPIFYIVNEDFPRVIRSGGLHEGISDVSYSISLEGRDSLSNNIYNKIKF